MNDDAPVCEAFYVLAELAIALDAAPLGKFEACWECEVDSQWKLAVNGHDEAKVSSLSAVAIEPFHCYVMFNGWPAGIFSPYGGTIAAGAAANEGTFIAAMRRRITASTGQRAPA